MRYADNSGNSGVDSFEISDGAIIVQFHDGSAYLYNASRPGPYHVSQLVQRALAGRGLNGYINKHVRKRYAKKLR